MVCTPGASTPNSLFLFPFFISPWKQKYCGVIQGGLWQLLFPPSPLFSPSPSMKKWSRNVFLSFFPPSPRKEEIFLKAGDEKRIRWGFFPLSLFLLFPLGDRNKTSNPGASLSLFCGSTGPIKDDAWGKRITPSLFFFFFSPPPLLFPNSRSKRESVKAVTRLGIPHFPLPSPLFLLLPPLSFFLSLWREEKRRYEEPCFDRSSLFPSSLFPFQFSRVEQRVEGVAGAAPPLR